MRQKTFKKYFLVKVTRRESAFYEDDFNDVVEEMWIEVIDRRTFLRKIGSGPEYALYYWDGKNLHVENENVPPQWANRGTGFTLTKTPYISDVVEKYVMEELL
jgi:hypothetical protein